MRTEGELGQGKRHELPDPNSGSPGPAEWLRAAGFREVTGYETLTGKPLAVGSSRCTAVAVK